MSQILGKSTIFMPETTRQLEFQDMKCNNYEFFLYDDQYVSRYIVCDDGESVQDIFWTNPDSFKLFNIFLIVLIIDLTYKTNKTCIRFCKLSVLHIQR